jgi:tRNA pseudouridine55 synthase
MEKAPLQLDFEAGVVLLIDKPLTWTSFDVVKKLKGITRAKKIGHAGTLDPLATGLLVICTGKLTKSIQGIQDADKEYHVEFRLGATTPSYDAEFPPENQQDASHISLADVQAVLPPFVGMVAQVPPVYSAVKIDGERAYKAARAGRSIEMRSRTVRIDSITLHSLQDGVVSAQVNCGKGTYIRSLVHDIGQALGVGAYITALRRTRIGLHHVDAAWTLDDLNTAVRAARTVLTDSTTSPTP